MQFWGYEDKANQGIQIKAAKAHCGYTDLQTTERFPAYFM